MPANKIVSISDTAVELTEADVTAITIVNHGPYDARIYGTTGAAPGASDGYIVLGPGMAIINRDLADLFPGVAGADRVWAEGAGQVFVSHA